MLGFRPFRTFSWRRLFLYGSGFVAFWIFVFSLTPITSPLPPYTGPHEVGVLDLETEVERRILHEAVLIETGEKAFELSTLAITLYYPSTLPPRSPSDSQPIARPWLPQPISLIGTGYARLAGVYFPPFQALFTFTMWLLGSKTFIPGHIDAPVLSNFANHVIDETGVSSDSEPKFFKEKGTVEEVLELRDVDGLGSLPCVVFTHGMAGMSQSYSHYLGSIASHGYVVAAIEHRDGSGPGTIVHYPDGEERKVWHIKLQDLESKPSMSDLDLKAAQLAFREAEIEETVSVFQRLNSKEGATMANLKPKSPQTALPGFKGRLDLSAITVIGHSYGATGALQALNPTHPLNSPKNFPLNGGIALDPGKGSGTLNKNIEAPLLVLQSGEWTENQVEFYGQGLHFDVVRKLVHSMKKGWFMTLSGTAHPSCTDAPLIVPWIMKMVTGTRLNAEVALREYIDVSVDFLGYLRHGHKKGVLKSEITSSEGPLGDQKKRGSVKGREGADWKVHVVPNEI